MKGLGKKDKKRRVVRGKEVKRREKKGKRK